METDTKNKTDRFTPLMIFASDHDFPAFAAEHGIGYKTVLGLYQGLIEESFVVSIYDARQVAGAELLKGQDSVLLLAAQEGVFGGHRDVYLVGVADDFFLDSFATYIGHWRKVSTSEALHSDAWTCYPEDNAWYVVKMPTSEGCDTLSQ